jgi:class 3 adenylate cyclase/tetratricopeptide (TPR) repeat protein
MFCPACGTENRGDRRFCRECGAALAAACPSCGFANDPGDRYCGSCGAALDAAEATAAASGRREGSERRMTSILFADIVGFTPLAEHRDPEEVRELLDRYFDVARQVVQRHAGTLEKFIGDAVVAVWGTPVAQEDDAERAVRTALELVSAVRALGAEQGVDLAARAAVTTGHAAVTLGAEGQGMVAGDVVNTTARIQAAAEPGTVLVDEGTRRAAEASIAFEAAGTRELKGKSEPVAVWRALRVIAGMRGGGRSGGLEPPFVGRERELSLLKQLLHATAEDERAHLTVLSGIGGIGKSRLAWEFEKYVDGLVDVFLWHRGRCLSYGDGVAFWALAEIVRQRCRIVEDERADVAAAKLDEALAGIVPAEEVEVVRGPLQELLGLSVVSEGDRHRLFPAWRLFIERMSEQAPVVLLFEDIQWADTALLEFIDYLLEWSRRRPLFVLALSRPELAQRRPDWGGAARGMTALTLEPLDDEQMLELVRGMIPGAPKQVIERIADRAEGVPLYAVETVRMLLDRGLLRREGDAIVPTGDLETLEVPETLHALIAARLDALPDAERRLIENAAVLGKSFTVGGLTAVSDLPEADVQPMLDALVKREVLTLQTDPTSPERGQYAFVQAIVRTIAYETVGWRERKRLHLACARHLEAIGGEELAEVIAAHFMDAYRLAPDDEDAGRIREHALERLVRAGERAAGLAAPGEAERLLGAAADLADDDRVQARLLEQAGQLALADGRSRDAHQRFARSAALYDGLKLTHDVARVNARSAEGLFLDGRVGEAVAAMEPAYAVLRDQEQDSDLAVLAAQYGRMLGFVDRTAESFEPLERALVISERLGLWDTLSSALNTKSLWLIAEGRQAEGLALMNGALAVALAHDSHQDSMRAYFNLGFIGSLVDDTSGTPDNDGLRLARRLGDRGWERAFLVHVSMLEFATGRWDDALALAYQAGDETGDQFSRAGLAHPAATVLAFRGDADGAEELMERSLFRPDTEDAQNRANWAAAEGLRLMAAERWEEAMAAAAVWELSERSMSLDHPAAKYAYTVWATCAFRAGDIPAARSYLERLSSLTPTQRTPLYEAQRRRFRALLGECDDTLAEISAAADILRTRNLRFHLMLLLADAAEVLELSDGEAAAEALAEARQLAAEMGAVTVIRRLDALMPPSAATAEG